MISSAQNAHSFSIRFAILLSPLGHRRSAARLLRG